MSTEAIPGRLIAVVRRRNRPVCVMLPGSGGGLTPYLRLASFIGATHDVYVVRAAGLLPDEEPESTVPEMTESVLDVLDRAGLVPDVVFGWSMGGVIAWEVCAELAGRGRRPDLVMVDSFPPPDASTPEQDDEVRETIIGYLGAKPAQDTVDRLLRTFGAHVAALRAHRTERPYDGRVLLLMCSPAHAEARVTAVARWRGLAGDLVVGSVGSDHYQVFEPRYLPELTAAVGGFLGCDEEVKR